MRHHLAAAIVAGIVTLSVPSVAAPLIYVETVDGALDSSVRPLGNLGVGVNTVSGARSGFERFSVSLPDTMQLTNISMLVSDIVLQNPGNVRPSSGRIELGGDLSGGVLFRTNGTFDVFSGALDGEKTINVALLGFTVGEGNVGVSYGYTVSFTVVQPTAAVPEPASLALFGGALLGLGALRRRRRA